jgi:hypothetical protein
LALWWETNYWRNVGTPTEEIQEIPATLGIQGLLVIREIEVRAAFAPVIPT